MVDQLGWKRNHTPNPNRFFVVTGQGRNTGSIIESSKFASILNFLNCYTYIQS